LVLSHPRKVTAVALVFVAVVVAGIGRLAIDADAKSLVPAADPSLAADRRARTDFQLRDCVIVMLDTGVANGALRRDALLMLERLTRSLAAIDGIGSENTTSLCTENANILYPGEGTFVTFAAIGLRDDAGSAALRATLEEPYAATLRQTLVSADFGAAAVFVEFPDRGDAPRDVIAAELRRVVDEFADSPYPLRVAGSPIAEYLLGRHIAMDLITLLPGVVAMMAVVLWYSCRNFWGVSLALVEVSLAVAFVFGFMGWMKIPLQITGTLLPVILATVGITDDLHILLHYQNMLRGKRSAVEALSDTLRDVAPSIYLTTLTTICGFASFGTAAVRPIANFGLCATVGILFSFFWSLLVFPAILLLLGADRIQRDGIVGGPSSMALGVVARRPRTVLAVVTITTVAATPFLSKLYVQDSWLTAFASRSEIVRDTDRVNALLSGAHVLTLRLSAVKPSLVAFDRSDGLAAVRELESFLGSDSRVGGVRGIPDYLDGVACFWAMPTPLDGNSASVVDHSMLVRRLELSRGLYRRRKIIDDDGRETIVTVFLKNANYRETDALMAAIQDYRKRHLAPAGIDIAFAGDVAVSQAMIRSIVTSQNMSACTATTVAFTVLLAWYRSIAWAFLAIAPTLGSVVWVLAGMAILDIPIGVATSMFFALTVGIAVDFGVFLADGYRRARGRCSAEPVSTALREVGRPILIDGIVLSAGFGILAFSQLAPNAHLAAIVICGVAASVITTLFGLGSLLALLPGGIARSTTSCRLPEQFGDDSAENTPAAAGRSPVIPAVRGE
jgi:predicted RND superfamily exporter protein